VVRVHGLVSMVLAGDGRTYACHVRRLLKTLAIEGRSVVTVGDHVWFRPGSTAGSDGLIEKV
jgi:ribosome biogenesis GTPase / thiamine phosphate phosphatase